jgi:serine/threonine-protein kinase
MVAPRRPDWSAVKQLLAEALERAPLERRQFLDKNCNDPAVRGAVERLLVASEQATASETFLDTPAVLFAGPVILEVDEYERDGAPALRDALAGRYTIERLLGRGGMGAVYLAQDERHGRAVAVKVLHPAIRLPLSLTDGPSRFQREIEFVARLTHPHIVTLHDSGSAAGALYYVMPYIEGESLRERLARTGPQSIDGTVRVLRDVTRALAYAHRRGVAHRDIKPGNILLNLDGDALVSDFGVARAIAAANAPGVLPPETATGGIVLGSAAYMAPEQAAADPATDHRADLYALGVVAYEMLTGAPPFAGRSAHEMASARLTDTPYPVASRRADTPPEVAALVMQLLARNPDDRPADAVEVLNKLDAAISTSSSAIMHPQRRTTPVRTFAAACVLALVLLTAFFAGPFRRDAERSIAVLPFVAESGAEGEPFSDGLTDELITALSHVPGLRVAGRTSTFAIKGRGLTVRAIADSLGVTTVLEGSVRRDGERLKVTARLVDTRDDRVLWSETYDRELRDLFAIQERIARDIVSALSVRLTRNGMPQRLVERGTDDIEAYQLYLKGRFLYNTRNHEGLLRARAYFEQAIRRDTSYARPYAGIANVYNNLAVFGYERPDVAFPKARAAAERALALDSTLAEAHAALAQQRFVYEWNWDAAESAFEHAIALDPGFQGTRNLYSMYLHVTGRHEAALAQLRIARELDPLVSIGPLAGRIYVNTRRPDAAIRELSEALELNPQLDLALELLGHANFQKGMYREAIASLERAAALSGPRDSAQLAYMYGVTGDTAQGRAVLQRLIGTQSQRYLPPFHIAMAYAGLGDADAAFRWLELGYQQRGSFMEGLAVTAGFDAIRSDPRFDDLLHRMELDGVASMQGRAQ